MLHKTRVAICKEKLEQRTLFYKMEDLRLENEYHNSEMRFGIDIIKHTIMNEIRSLLSSIFRGI